MGALPASEELVFLASARSLKLNAMGKHGKLIIWHDSSLVVRFLGLMHAAKTRRVAMGTRVKKAICADVGKKGITKFEQMKNGLFAHGASERNLAAKPRFD